MHVCVCVWVCMCVCVCVCVCVHVCVCVKKQKSIFSYSLHMTTCMYMYMHGHILFYLSLSLSLSLSPPPPPSFPRLPVLSVKDIKMTSVFTMLRKCCNHPYLLEFPLTPEGDFLVNEQIVTSCGKIMLLDRMLSPLIERGHKVHKDVCVHSHKIAYKLKRSLESFCR